SPPITKVSSDQSSTFYDPGAMSYSTTYYWYIVARDNHAATSTGSEWDFTTGSAPNNPPTAYIDSMSPNPADEGASVSF
ncbi:unnamed protein product, partial [marine sediment metagenome]